MKFWHKSALGVVAVIVIIAIGLMVWEPLAAVRPGADPADDSLRALEARHIGKLMGELEGNKPDVAKRLGIGLTTLYRKLEEYGLG